MELFKLLGTIAIDNSGANNAIDDTTGKASKAEGTMSKAFKKIGTAVVAAFAIEKVVSFGKACVEAAASVKAANSQFEQTFGELQDQATAAIDRVAESSNILDTRLRGVGTSIYAFAKTTGMESADALGMMERALKVTADNAAYYDRSLEDTSESLKSFLKGNYENDAALGLSCTETTRNAAANELYGKSFKDLSEAQKQLTLLKMVEDANALSGAMGQAAREGSGWENVTGNLKESWTQFQAVIGAPILEAIVPIVQGITNVIVFLTDKVKNASSIIATNFPELVQFFQEVSNGFRDTWENHLKPVFEAIGNFLNTTLKPAFEFVFGTIIQPLVDNVFGFIVRLWNDTLKPVFDGICDFITGVFTGDWQKMGDGIMGILGGLWDGIVNIFSSVGNFLSDSFGKIKDCASKNWSEIADNTKKAWSVVKEVATEKMSEAKAAIEKHGGGIKGFFGAMGETVKKNWTDAFTKMNEASGGKLGEMLSSARNKLTDIKNAFSEKLSAAKDTVGNAIGKIKDFFKFEWSLPKLKMPHFNISGEFSLNPLSVPSFGIDWYAKAMDDPMIMDSPTAFGINSLGQLMAGGEAGSEVVSGTDTLMNMISNSVASQNRGLIEVLYKILDAILAMDENMGGNLREALDGTAFSVNNREFARLVKAVN